jgi:aspartate/methionine/tyrosine aminotransferase
MSGREVSRRVEQLAPSIIRQMSGRRRPTSVDMSIGEPAIAPEPDLLDRAIQTLRSGPQGYTENAGMAALREAIAHHYALEGRDRVENVIVTVGSEEAVFLSMLSVLDPGEEVLIPEPGYPAYRGIANLIGAVPVTYPIDRSTGLIARAETIARLVTPKTRALVLNGPSNPFGTIDDANELEKLARLAESHGITVLSDEIYRDLVYVRGEPPSIARMTRASIFVSGLSKSCSMTGLRLGFLIAGEKLVKHATLAHQLTVTCAARLAQLAALEVFKEPRRLRAHLPYYEACRAAVREAEPLLPKDAPLLLGGGAFYAILDVSAYANGDPLGLALELLEKEDVVVVPGVAFGPSGTWFWRLSYAAGPETSREGITRIGRFLVGKRR